MYRDRRKLLIVVPVLVFLLIATSVYLSGGYITRAVFPKLHLPTTGGAAAELSETEAETELETELLSSPTPSTSDEPSPTPVAPTPIVADGACQTVHVARPGADAQQELFFRVPTSKSMSMPFLILHQPHSIACNVRH
jgi:hypothetical protein